MNNQTNASDTNQAVNSDSDETVVYPTNLVRVTFHFSSKRKAEAEALAQKFGIKKMGEVNAEADRLLDEHRQAKNPNGPRKGRGDTGTQVFGTAGLSNCCTAPYISYLLSNAYKVSGAKYEEKPQWQGGRQTGEKKYAVTAFLSNDLSSTHSPELAEALLSHVEDASYDRTDLWANDDGDTLNMSGSRKNLVQRHLDFDCDAYDYVTRKGGTVERRIDANIRTTDEDLEDEAVPS